LRKYLIVAVAAFTAIAFAAVSSAQTPAASMDVKVTPTKAGTKKKPKNSKITLSIENSATNRTMSKLTITTAKTFKLSTKGLTKCDEDTLSAEGPAGCPRASRVGKGTASALVGVNAPNPTPLTFDVTAVVTGPRNIAFDLQGRELPVHVLAPGTLSGRKLTITVPVAAQQPAPGTYAGLVGLQTTLSGKKGKKYLASTTGCKGGKHAFSAVMTFVPNGSDLTGGTVNTSGSATCKKP
jgi:hypothetical protein